MARLDAHESARRSGGFFSGTYETDYTVSRDNGEDYRTFTTYDEAKAYYDYLQTLENQEKMVQEARRTADETERLRKATEEQNAILREQRYRRPPVDPEYLEWKRQKMTAQLKKQKEEEDREKQFLLYDAKRIDSLSTISYHDSTKVGKIIKKTGYVFNKSEAVLYPAQYEKDREVLWHIFTNYKDKEVLTKVLKNSYARRNALWSIHLTQAFDICKKDLTLLLLFFQNCLSHSKDYNKKEYTETIRILRENSVKLQNLIDSKKIDEDVEHIAKQYIFEGQNRERILNGDIRNEEDLNYAERILHSNECETLSYNFFLKVAKKSKITSIDSSIRIKGKNLTNRQFINIYKALLANPHQSSHTDHFLYEIIELANDEATLLEIRPMLEGRDSRFNQWLTKMENLGYISERKSRKMAKQYHSQPSSSGCMVIFAALSSFVCTIAGMIVCLM